MLPASFQMPAAIVLLVGGLLSCFAGYRVFRVVLGIYGFILGALFASSVMGTEQTLWMIAGGLRRRPDRGADSDAAYFVGVALIGAGIGAGAAMRRSGRRFGREPGIIAVIVLAILGALGALALQRYVIIVATAFGGAQTAIVGGAALLGNRGVATRRRAACICVYPLDPLPGDEVGSRRVCRARPHRLVVQLATTAKGKK